jgi:DNA-binding response OmpR family regulator
MKKILVVDDDIDILTVVNMVLSFNKFSVMATPRWQDIEPLIKTFCPDLILLDVSLSGADGRDICEKLKNAEKTKNIPIILFSAHYNLINDTRGCKPDGLITKPFEVPYLIETIRKNIA